MRAEENAPVLALVIARTSSTGATVPPPVTTTFMGPLPPRDAAPGTLPDARTRSLASVSPRGPTPRRPALPPEPTHDAHDRRSRPVRPRRPRPLRRIPPLADLRPPFARRRPRPAARGLDEILGYHYYTELAHSAGMPAAEVDPGLPAAERVRNLARHLPAIDNTVQYSWLMEIARTFYGFPHDAITEATVDDLLDRADRSAPGRGEAWDAEVWGKTGLEAVFLTNDFDDPLTGFDPLKFVPCLRTDDLVLKLHEPRDRGCGSAGRLERRGRRPRRASGWRSPPSSATSRSGGAPAPARSACRRTSGPSRPRIAEEGRDPDPQGAPSGPGFEGGRARRDPP